jgi:hypothetical protein
VQLSLKIGSTSFEKLVWAPAAETCFEVISTMPPIANVTFSATAIANEDRHVMQISRIQCAL